MKNKILIILSIATIFAVGIWQFSSARINNPTNTSILVPTSRTLTAGTGLTGGGDLSADRTFNVGAGTNIIVNADDVAVTSTPSFTSISFSDNTLFRTAYKSAGFTIINATSTVTASTTPQKLFYQAMTISQIDCATSGANITISSDERASSTRKTAGTEVFNGGSLICGANGNSTSTFANATIAANAVLNFDLDTLANATTTLWVDIKYVND